MKTIAHILRKIFNYGLLAGPVALASFLAIGQEKTSINISTSGHQMEMNYRKWGHGPEKWVLVHGLGSYSRAFEKMLEALPENVEAYAMDLPGFGETPLNGFEVSMPGYARAVHDFVVGLQLKGVVLMGHSMGGQIAMNVAIENPEWLQKIVLLAPAGIEQFTEKDKAWFDAVATESLYLNLTDAQIKRNFDINFFGGKLPEDALFMYEDRLKIKQDPHAYQQYCGTIVKCMQGMLANPVYAQLDGIEVPTLALFGKDDALIPNRLLHPRLSIGALIEKLNADHPAIASAAMESTGHFVQWDRPKKTLDMIQDFIANPKKHLPKPNKK